MIATITGITIMPVTSIITGFTGQENYHDEGLRKGHHNEKFKGTAFVPPKIRKDYKNKNKHQYASNIPKFKDRVKKIDMRGDKRTRQVAEHRLNTNPFKQKVAKDVENNRRAGNPIGENRPKKFMQNNKQVQKRLDPVNKNVTKNSYENKKQNRQTRSSKYAQSERACRQGETRL